MIRALIVDDEVTTRQGLRAHVHWRRCGVDEVKVVSTSDAALRICKEEKPEILLSDIRMPGMTGIEMCEEIRKTNVDIQIIFISGFSDKEYFKSAISLSAVSYVEKPVDLVELEEAITSAVQKAKKIHGITHISQEETLLVRVQKALKDRRKEQLDALIDDIAAHCKTLDSQAEQRKLYYRIGCLVDSTLHPENSAAQSDAYVRSLFQEENSIENIHAWIAHELLAFVKPEHLGKFSQAVERVTVLVAENIASQELSVQWLSDQVFLSPTYLSAIFKRETGLAPSSYIVAQRMELAKRLLENEHLSVIQIAKRVGYSDEKYFAKTFKKHVGKTPMAYRKSCLW